MQISMPGMMDTVLNLGLNDEVVAGLAARSGERFAYDSYRRFLDMFGDVVCDKQITPFPHLFSSCKDSGILNHQCDQKNHSRHLMLK